MAFQALNDKVVIEIPEAARGHWFTDPESNEKKFIEYPKPRLEDLKEPLLVISVGENVPETIRPGDKIKTFKEHVTLIPLEDRQYILLQWFDIDIKITD